MSPAMLSEIDNIQWCEEVRFDTLRNNSWSSTQKQEHAQSIQKTDFQNSLYLLWKISIIFSPQKSVKKV